jgi:hypothetical protein
MVEKNNLLSKKNLIFLFVLMTIIGAFWSWKSSGVLMMSKAWEAYPTGFSSMIHDYNWPIMSENYYYLSQCEAFRGATSSILTGGIGGFEIQRSLYAVFCNIFWFLGTMGSMWMTNVVCWFLSGMSLSYFIKKQGGSSRQQWMAFLLVLGGQGFLYSVGEFSPHVMGYSFQFWILGLCAYFNIWSKESSHYDVMLMYGLIGLMQFAYNSAWLSLPILMYFHYQRGMRLQHVVIGLCLATIPYLMFISGYKILYPNSTNILKSATVDYNTFTYIVDFIKTYTLGMIENIVSFYGVLMCCALAGIGVFKKYRSFLIIFLIQLLIATRFNMAYGLGKGYVVFNIIALLYVIASEALSNVTSKFKLCFILGAYYFFAYSPFLIKNNFFLQIFEQGIFFTLNQLHQWGPYAIHLF